MNKTIRKGKGKGKVRFSIRNVTYGIKRRKRIRKNCTFGGRWREKSGSAKKWQGKVVKGKGKGKMKPAMNPADVLGKTGPSQGIE